MDAIFGILIFLFGAVTLIAAVFLALFQPLWGIIDVATSKEHSSGTKVAVILLTFLLLGPIMTFFYACFGTRSGALRKISISAVLVLVVSIIAMFALSALHPAAKEALANVFDDDGMAAGGPGDIGAPESSSPKMDEVTADELALAPFKAVHYVPLDARRWSVSIADFTLSGPVDHSALPVTVPSIYPLNQIAIDASGPVIYGTTTHKVGKIVPATGHFVELEVDPALPRMSWPATVAFDAKNRKLVVTGRSGVYTYDPATGEWLQPTGFDELQFLSLTYDDSENAFYGIVSQPARRVMNRIVKLSDNGAVVSTIDLSPPLPAAGIPAGRVQLVRVDEVLVILIAAHYSQSGPRKDEVVNRRTYVVHPGTGQTKRVARQE